MQIIKKLISGIGIIAFIAVFAIMMFASDIDHIEDLNGEDNYALQQITDFDILDMNMGALNLSESKELFNNLPTFKSDKYTGVSEIYLEDILYSNRTEITMYNLTVRSGNFKAVVVYNDEIIHEFTVNSELSETFVLEDVKGTVAIRIAGESADFKLSYSIL